MTQQKRLRRLADPRRRCGGLNLPDVRRGAGPGCRHGTRRRSQFSWSFSDYLGSVFTGHSATGGAAVSGTGVVFGGGAGTGSVAAGTFDMKYQGSAAFEWHGVDSHLQLARGGRRRRRGQGRGRCRLGDPRSRSIAGHQRLCGRRRPDHLRDGRCDLERYLPRRHAALGRSTAAEHPRIGRGRDGRGQARERRGMGSRVPHGAACVVSRLLLLERLEPHLGREEGACRVHRPGSSPRSHRHAVVRQPERVDQGRRRRLHRHRRQSG